MLLKFVQIGSAQPDGSDILISRLLELSRGGYHNGIKAIIFRG